MKNFDEIVKNYQASLANINREKLEDFVRIFCEEDDYELKNLVETIDGKDDVEDAFDSYIEELLFDLNKGISEDYYIYDESDWEGVSNWAGDTREVLHNYKNMDEIITELEEYAEEAFIENFDDIVEALTFKQDVIATKFHHCGNTVNFEQNYKKYQGMRKLYKKLTGDFPAYSRLELDDIEDYYNAQFED